jgi:hypothetical protein
MSRLSTPPTPAATLLAELLAQPDVELGQGDMAGERSVRVKGREFLHVHGRSLLHIHLTRAEKEAALASGEAEPHPYAPRSGMVELNLISEDQLPAARRLARQAMVRVAALADRLARPHRGATSSA